MALVIIPIGVLLGLVLPARRAAMVTLAIAVLAMVILISLLLAGVEVSPLEMGVLVLGTPLAMWLATATAHRRHKAPA
jgi:hypothetical protein